MKSNRFARLLSMLLCICLSSGLFVLSFSISGAVSAPKEITVACSKDSFPFHFVDEKGNVSGITIDYWNLWSKKTGIKVKFLVSDWNTSLENVKDRKADAHAGCFYTSERDSYMDYAFPISETEAHIFYNSKLQGISELKDLKSYAIGVLKGDYAEEYIQRNLNDASIRPFNTYKELAEAAKNGGIQVFIADTRTALNAMENILPEGMFTYKADKPLYTNYFYATVQEGRADLVQLINSGMGSITATERQNINTKWALKDDRITKSIKVAVSMDYAPFSFPDENGNPQGLLVDMWRLWGQKTGFAVQFVTDNWTNTLKDVETGAADIHSGLFFTNERSRYMSFSRMFYTVESKIFYNEKLRNFSSVKDLQGKVVGANRNSFQELYLKEHFPDMKIVSFDYSTSMVEAAENNLIDAFIEESVSLKANYQVLGKAFNNKELPDVSFTEDMMAGVTKAKPELLVLVNQGLEEISRAEWKQLEEKWIADPRDRVFKMPESLNLNDSEKAWIAQHPVLRIGADKDQQPIQFGEAGKPEGIATDYTLYILDRIGIKPDFKLMDWPDILSGIKKGDTLDVSFNIQKTDERTKYLSFSRPFLKVPHVIVTKTDKKLINSLDELKGLTVAVEKGYYKIEHFKKEPGIHLIEVNNALDALLAVSSGQADAYVGDQLTTTHYISSKSLKNLRISEYRDLGTYNVSAGFRKELAPLAGIINKVLDSMTESEKRAIISKYSNLSDEGSVYLSDAERIWLRNHNPVRAGMQTGWAPVEYMDEQGAPSGLSSDYYSRLERMLGMQLEPVQSASYSDLIEQMKTGKLDIMTAAMKSPYQLKYMNFSSPYMVSPMALITLDESQFVGGIGDIGNERLGVIKDSFADDVLKLYHSGVVYQTYPDEARLYQALSDRNVDLILDSLVSIDYMSRLKGIHNLRVSGITPYNCEICIGIRKDWPTTLSVVNKMLDGINPVQKDSAEKYWLSKLPSGNQAWERYRGILITVSSVFILVAGTFVFWNRRLQKEIKERKMIEIELKRAKESADVANRSKTEFLANMSHEIRTPMNAVIGMATLMERTSLNAQQQDYLVKINQAAYNLLNIINDILDFSKIEAGKMSLEEVEFELDTVIDNVSSIVGIRAKEKNLELIIRRESNVPSRIIGDSLRLEQVLINLASNAVKFTQEGEVEVRINCTRTAESKATLIFSVRDTGIGMDDEQVSQLFKPFTQSDSSTTRKFGGTGLGLSISKKLVDMMGGRIWAICKPGGGCVFTFEVTFRYVDEPDRIGDTVHRVLENLRVLVVEDNPSAREVLEGYLKDFNFMTHCVESGEEALDAISQGEYDLALIDWKLPGIDGLDTARRIRNLGIMTPKMVILTAYGNENLIDSVTSEGLDGLLSKPISASALYNAILDLFSERSATGNRVIPIHARPSNSFLKGKQILVVEDNAMNQQLAQELLSSAGAEVSVAGNGQDALARLEEPATHFDLIFMDLQMPEMDGFEATSKIRLLEGWKETPIIAMTADVLTGIYEDCIRSGMNDYISKPIIVNELYNKLAFWLNLDENGCPESEGESTAANLSLTGVDSEKALQNLGGNAELYQQVLTRFAEAYDSFDDDVRQLMQPDKNEEAVRYFHTLKGHGGNVGSHSISTEAAKAELLLSNGDYESLDTLIRSLGEHVRILVSELAQNTLPVHASDEQTDVWETHALIRQVEIIRQAINSRKPSEIQNGLAALTGRHAPADIRSELDDLMKQCEHYRYKAAAISVDEILKKLQSRS